MSCLLTVVVVVVVVIACDENKRLHGLDRRYLAFYVASQLSLSRTQPGGDEESLCVLCRFNWSRVNKRFRIVTRDGRKRSFFSHLIAGCTLLMCSFDRRINAILALIEPASSG
jgi:hypothetical protein